MKGLVQVSSALYSLAAFIMYIPQGGRGWGAEDFGEFSLERKGGMVNISEGRKGRMPIFLNED